MSMLIIDAYPRLTKVDKSREIGIEIEIEGDRLIPHGMIASVDKWWTTHQDGSLRGNAIEYVLHTPVNRKHVAPALSALKTAFKAQDTVINDSDRAGVHVHINCQSLTVDQVINFLLVYYIFEDALVKFCGEEREGNLFCLRAQDAEGLLSALRHAKRSGSFSNFREETYRYASVNIPALMKFGTLEFRSLKTPQEVEDINPWVEMLLAIKDESLTFKDGKQIIQTFSENGEHAYLKKVFGKQAKKLNCDNLSVMLRNGVRRIQDVAYATSIPKVASKKKYNLNWGQEPNPNPNGYNRREWENAEIRRISALNTRYTPEDPRGSPKPVRDDGMPANYTLSWDRVEGTYLYVNTEDWNPRPYPEPQPADPGVLDQQAWEDRENIRLDDLSDRYWPVQEALEAGLSPEGPNQEDFWLEGDQQIMWDDYDHRWRQVGQAQFVRRPYPYLDVPQPAEAAQPVPNQQEEQIINRWNRVDGVIERVAVPARNWRNLHQGVELDNRPRNPDPARPVPDRMQIREMAAAFLPPEPMEEVAPIRPLPHEFNIDWDEQP